MGMNGMSNATVSTATSTERNHEPWGMVAAGALITCVAIGAIFALAVFLQPMSTDTGWSRAGISSAMTFAFISMGIAGFGWGALSDRIGPRVVVLAGALLLGLANVLASRATTLFQFQLLYGALMGVAAGSFFAPVIATTASWFDRHRSLAVSLVSAGIGVAPMTISPFAAWLVTHHGWRTAQLMIGIGAWLLLIPAALVLKPAPAVAAAKSESAPVGMPASRALRSRSFIVLGLTYFACCAAHSGPIFHTVSCAIGCGLPTMAALSALRMALGPAIGGWIFDHFGSYTWLYIGSLALGLGAIAIAFAFPRVQTRDRGVKTLSHAVKIAHYRSEALLVLQDFAALPDQEGASTPNCFAYSALSRCQPLNFMASGPTIRPMR